MKIGPLGIMLLISVCISSSFLDQSLAIMPEDIEQKADLLERQGEYETARAFLRNEYLKTGNINILLKWVELDGSVFENLRRSNNHFAIQAWTPYEHSDNESKTEKAVRWGKYWLSVPLDIMGGFGWASGSAAARQTDMTEVLIKRRSNGRLFDM